MSDYFFAKQRSVKEAIGFYLLSLVAAIIAGGSPLTDIILIIPVGPTYFEVTEETIMEAILSSVISFSILKEKKLLGNPGFILLVLLAGLITLYIGALSGPIIGALVGLIIPAYLTTRPANNV